MEDACACEERNAITAPCPGAQTRLSMVVILMLPALQLLQAVSHTDCRIRVSFMVAGCM